MKTTLLLKALWKKIIKIFLPSLTASMPEDILDTDKLLRRVIFTNPSYVRPDLTLTSFAFTPRKQNGIQERGLSVDIERLTTYEISIKDRFNYRLYSINAGYVRQLGLDCEHDPIEGNEAHAL